MVCLCIHHDQRTQEGDLKFSIECDGVLMYLVLVHASPVVQSYNRLVVSFPSFLPPFLPLSLWGPQTFTGSGGGPAGGACVAAMGRRLLYTLPRRLCPVRL
jgi:hypothetical protein